VLDTDYDHFALVYRCTDLDNDQSKEAMWLLSRTHELPAEVKDKAEGLLDKYFDRKATAFVTTHHDNTCKYQ
jgi:apolipoprotein D and lipocalin family protein